jgi:hypothetical protein
MSHTPYELDCVTKRTVVKLLEMSRAVTVKVANIKSSPFKWMLYVVVASLFPLGAGNGPIVT